MAYTPPSYTVIDFDFTEAYAAPGSTAIDFDFGSSSVNLIPIQGSVTVTGSAPEVTQGHNLTPSIGSVILTGGTPSVIQGHTLQPPQGIIVVTGQTPRNTVTPLVGSITVTGQTPTVTQGHVIQAEQGIITVTGGRPGSVIIQAVQGDIIVTGGVPGEIIATVDNPEASGFIVLCTLTGAADSLEDVILPVSTLTRRFTSDLRSVYTVVVPNGIDYADAINDRPNGSLSIETITSFTDGSISSFTDIDHALESTRDDQGAFSYSFTLTAGTTLSDQTRKQVTLYGVSVISNQANGEQRVRSNVQSELFVGDTVLVNDSIQFDVDNITTVINPTSKYMEAVSG